MLSRRIRYSLCSDKRASASDSESDNLCHFIRQRNIIDFFTCRTSRQGPARRWNVGSGSRLGSGLKDIFTCPASGLSI